MPLDPSSMVSGFTALFQGPPLGAIGGSNKMASIYFKYASKGLFGASKPVFTGSEQSALASTLAAVFALPVPNPAAFGTAWGAGLLAFWTSPPIAVTGAQSGAVTAISGAASLPAALLALVLVPFNPAPVVAAALAAALHSATLTTKATVAPPPSTVVTIS